MISQGFVLPSGNDLNFILWFSLIPGLALVVGTLISSLLRPGPKFTSATQHFAAGVVFAAVALELLPQLGAGVSRLTMGLGFILGVLVMLAVGGLAERLEAGAARSSRFPLGLGLGIGLDIWIDGLLLGIAFVAGTRGGELITMALSLEILFLGLSLGTTLAERGAGHLFRLGVSFLLALMVPFGAWLGAWILSQVSPQWMHLLIAFGVAALLFLVTEELLKEAHRKPDSAWITATFFLGFLLIVLLDHPA